MKIEKAEMTLGEDTLRITMPLQKVDKARRVVSGFATLDNEDKHGDIVTKEASSQAFSEFLGNLRLMHQPIPAGKVLNFREEQYFDPKTEKVYNGIYVDAYVSEGAENVWKMVLDGTLTGFSIGGDNVQAKTEFSKEAGKPVRKVNSYRMNELSLVDNPANAFSNILSIQKSADGVVTAEGSLADVTVENVFYCKRDHDPVALVDSSDNKECLDCGSPMKNIGWFESDGGDKVEKVEAIIQKFEADSTEGGENMSKDDKDVKEPANKVEAAEPETGKATKVESAEEVSPKGEEEVAPEGEEAKTATDVEQENVSVTGTGESKVEEAEQLNEATKIEDGEVAENPLNKLFDDLHSKIDSAFEKSNEKTAQVLAEATNEFEKKLGELAKNHNELSEKFGALTEKLDGMEKRFDTVEGSGAFKKSADLGGSEEGSSIEKADKRLWRGSIFSMGQVNNVN